MNIKEIKRKISDRSAIGPEEFLAGHIGMRDYVVELLNALDEPQKPVVPEFVAEWIEYAKKKGDSLRDSFKPWNLYGIEYSKADRWIDDNQETFAQAWLSGYEVEKEPLYYIKLPGGKNYDMFVDGRDGNLKVFLNGTPGTQYTEQQIKAIDERYWSFAVPVEEAVEE